MPNYQQALRRKSGQQQPYECGDQMTNEEVVQKVQDLISESLGVKKSELTPSSSFIDDLNADSLDIVELVMTIEKEFDIEIPDDEAERIRTVQDAVDYIMAHCS
jgi:acyl carrier protein